MAGALKQRWHLGWQAGREENKMLYQDLLHHQIHDCDVWGGHVWGGPSQTGPWSTETAWRGKRSYVAGTQWTFWCHRMVDLRPLQGSGREPETCSDRNEDTLGRQHRSGEQDLCCTGALEHSLWGWLERRCSCWRAIKWSSARGNCLFENWSLWVHISREDRPRERIASSGRKWPR